MGDIGGVFSLFHIYWLSFIFFFLDYYCPLSICGEERRMCSSQSVSGLLGLKIRVSFPSHLISFAIGGREGGVVFHRGRQRLSRGAAWPFHFPIFVSGIMGEGIARFQAAWRRFLWVFWLSLPTAGYTGLVCCIRPREWKVYVRTYCYETSILLVLSLFPVVSGLT